VFKKLNLSEKDYEYLTKGLSSGVLLGIIIGTLVKDILFFFALEGILGIICAFIFSYYKKFKLHHKI
jgi:ABC-type Mn2+/Zn2+ transport system permease subunit